MSALSDHPAQRWVRGGLIALATITGSVGGWQFFAPQSFYDDFPGFGHAWVSLFPPFNAHLMQDVGGFNLAFAALFAWAAWAMERQLVWAALVAWLVSATLHFAYHAGHLEPFAPGDAVAQMLSLGVVVVLPAVLLAATARWTVPRREQTAAQR